MLNMQMIRACKIFRRFPPLIEERPKPKDAFSEATDVPIVKFFAGVGSAERLDDVAPLREV